MATAKKTARKKTTSTKQKAATKKAPAKKAATKRTATKKAAAKSGDKLSQLDAAVKVLSESKAPMTTKAMIDAMGTKGYWSSPGGKTPAQTLYSALLREIQNKGKDARFVKVDRGQFALKK